MGSGDTVQQQYLDATQYFKRKWTALQDDVPVVEDVISMWLSYPHWERCGQLRQVLDLVIVITVTGTYETNFEDDAPTALYADTLLSSLHLVRSWFAHSFVGKTRKNLRGLLRPVESTDMLVSRLSDAVRGKPWDQLLKVGLDQTLARCVSVLTNDLSSSVTPMVDDYRSAVLAQLNVMEVVATSPIRASPKFASRPTGSSSKTKKPRSQADVRLKTPKKNSNVAVARASNPTAQSKTRTAGRNSSGKKTSSSRGRRTGGRPQCSKKLVLSTVDGGSTQRGSESSDDIRVRASRKGKKIARVESSDELKKERIWTVCSSYS